jgi:N-acetylneuraminate synthase
MENNRAGVKPGFLHYNRIIAEIGTSHSGEIDKAEALIKAANKAGADFAKFQIVFAEEIVHPAAGEIKLPGGSKNIFNEFKKIEQGENFFLKINKICKDTGIEPLFSVFGKKSLAVAQKAEAKLIKIASPENLWFELIEESMSNQKNVILSTGVSKQSDIVKIMHFFKKQNRLPEALLQCVTNYPAPESGYNLAVIPAWIKRYGISAGVSDHSRHPWLIPLTAAALGSTITEKHITLSNNTNGLDDKIALTPDSFAVMVEKLRKAQDKKQKEITDYLFCEFGKKRIKTIIGNNRKHLTDSEKKIYRTTNRSAVATSNILKK